MLSALHIENIAVISSVDIELDRGLSVLSGETGAGKSIIILSVRLAIPKPTRRVSLKMKSRLSLMPPKVSVTIRSSV